MNQIQDKPRYSLGEQGEFVIENYNQSKPFASFFPGIAGPHGIPMWLFYVNRGQCVCSMGIEDKEHPIMEFLSANRAYQLASTQCFRTFVKIADRDGTIYYEPFQQRIEDEGLDRTQRMIILPAQLTLEEVNRSLGLKFTVDYFNVVEDSYAGLIRVLRIENLTKKNVKLQVLDGLPMIIPYGVDNYNLKHMRRLVESFVEVINVEKKVPYFKGRVKQEDRPEVTRIKEGNFFVGFTDEGKGAKIASPIVDPAFIFGEVTDYSYPQLFLSEDPFRVKPGQICENRLPSAMGLFDLTLKGGESSACYEIIGNSPTVDTLNRMIPRICRASYVQKKQQQNAELTDELTQINFTHSSSRAFDLYSRQNFLDNTLRGGLPVSFKANGKTNTIHLYSRKHGDLERDYNDYRLSATNYSQGNGNFRDVNQNRRNDLLINPEVAESNVQHFYDLIQLDGFNPLGVKACSFSVKNRRALDATLRAAFGAKGGKVAAGFFDHQRFAPGQLMLFLAEHGLKPSMSADDFIAQVLACCEKHQETDAGHGFWSDHWIYNLDLLENYLSVYPEKLRHILLEKKTFTFWDNPHKVLPREDKYVIWDGLPMQLGAVVSDPDKEKMIRQRPQAPNEMRAKHGKGEIYRTTLINKMISLVLNKFASLDPFGVGIEMESDKPNWYDALNGLPGQFGSSISETIELKRQVLFLLDSLDQLKIEDAAAWPLYVEAKEFMDRLNALLKSHAAGKVKSDFEFWDKATTAKEEYREKTNMGVAGRETPVSAGELRAFLKLALKKINRGIEKAWDRKKNCLSTYFISKVVSYREIIIKGADGRKTVKRNGKGQVCFRPLKFKHIPLPLFLEGPVHYLKVERNAEKARALAASVRESGLFDRKLKMYKVNESLADQPMEIGRTRTFSPGWLENESIWMHMEYKYLLELLRSGLYTEFYRDFRTMLVPFLDPQVYGRSILENSSFICSSANPDANIHGNGFVARLSGSTAEFIHILLAMTVGDKPFRMNADGKLELAFQPALPKWLFSEKAEEGQLWIDGKRRTVKFEANTFSFIFLGSILVTYRNPARLDTFGAKGAQPRTIRVYGKDGQIAEIQGGVVSGKLARQIRDRQVSRIEVEVGK